MDNSVHELAGMHSESEMELEGGGGYDPPKAHGKLWDLGDMLPQGLKLFYLGHHFTY